MMLHLRNQDETKRVPSYVSTHFVRLFWMLCLVTDYCQWFVGEENSVKRATG